MGSHIVCQFRRPNRFPHFRNPVFNFIGIRRHFRRYVSQREEFLRVNFTVPNKLIVDVTEETSADFNSGFGEHPHLKCQVGNVNVFPSCGGFDFDDVPFVFAYRIQNVSTSVTTVGRQCGLENRTP